MPLKAPDFFTYFSNQPIKPDSLVEVELRGGQCFGYVKEIFPPESKRAYFKEEKLTLKPITRLINEKPVIFEYQKILASWLKNYYAISLPYAYSLIFPYPKILARLPKEKEVKMQKGRKRISWLKSFADLNKLKGQKILFLLPDELLIKDFEPKLKKINQQTFSFFSRMSQKKKISFLEAVLSEEKNWYLVSKTGIFFPWFNLEGLVILLEGFFLYKEYYKPPYFDYRTIAHKLAEILALPIYLFDPLPSFAFFCQRKKVPKIPINFEVLSSLTEVEKIAPNFQKLVFFVPQKLTSHQVICEFCSQNIKCPKCNHSLWLKEQKLFCPICVQTYPFEETCPYCKRKTNFVINQLGAKGIFRYLQENLPNPIFLEREKDYADLNFQKLKDFTIFGSFLLLQRDLPAIDAFFFFNFDQFFYTRDLFLREKFLRILYYFAPKTNQVFLISEKRPKSLLLIKNGTMLEKILQERKLENLPPYQRLVKLTFSLSNLKELQRRAMLVRNLILEKTKLEIIGPIFAYPEKQRKRYFLELLLKIPKQKFNLHQLLIDLPYLEKIDAEADSLS